jgi:hypothetical protein
VVSLEEHASMGDVIGLVGVTGLLVLLWLMMFKPF